MKTLAKTTVALLLAGAFGYAPLTAQAGLFDDDEARRAILDLRSRIDAANSRIDGKADKGTSLDLSTQNEQLRNEIAKLRGQIEVLANELANTQRRQKDFYTDLDGRLRKLEPQRATVDGKEVDVHPGEKTAFDAALNMFKGGDYKGAGQSFSDFLRMYPQSGYAAAAQYWLGNALYAQRDYKGSMAVLQTMVSRYPDHPKTPDAMLNIASSQMDLKDKAGARKTLESLLAQYPGTDAAQAARERLPGTK